MTAQDIFNGQAVAIGNTADLNTFMTPGLYYQNTNDFAAAGANYPEASAGSLEVYKHAGITQIYRIYNNSRSYIRTYWNNVWSAWVSSIDAAGGTINGELNLHSGFWISDKQTGITFGKDDASFNSANMLIKSWYGIGFYSTLTGNEGMAGYINVRTGLLQMAGQIIPGNYANFDARYFTKSEMDGRYLNDAQRGSQALQNGAHNSMTSWEAPSGCFITGVNIRTDLGDSRFMGYYYRALMVKTASGSWRQVGN